MYRLTTAAATAIVLCLMPLAADAASRPLVVAQATAPADTAIKAVQGDLARFEKQAANMRPGASGAKRTLKLLRLTEGRLNGSRNKSHPSWVEANDRLQALKARLVALAEGRTPGAAPAKTAAPETAAPKTAAPKASAPAQAAPAATGPGPADPNVERAGRELKLIDRQVAGLRPGDRRGGMRFLKDLGRIAKALNAAPDKKHPVWQGTVADYRRVNGHIVATLMQGIGAELAKIAKRQDALSELDLLFKSKSDEAKAELERNWQAASALGAPKHPDVQRYVATFKGTENKLLDRINAAVKEHQKLGDVQARVAEIEKRQRAQPVPTNLNPPFSEASINDYVAKVRTATEGTAEDFAYLKRIQGKTPLISTQALNRLLRAVGGKPGDVARSVQHSVERVDAWVEVPFQQVDFLADTDVNDPHHVANRLLGDGRPESTLKQMEEGVARVALAAAFDKGVGRKEGPDRAAQRAKLQAAKKSYTEMASLALSKVRLPKAVQKDEKFIDIAKQTLAKPKYKTVNPHKRLVINSKVRRKEKKEATASGSTLYVYHYVWDQYQVATAEKDREGPGYHIWYTTLKYFHKGGPTTPTEEWIISGRFKSVPILEENIDE